MGNAERRTPGAADAITLEVVEPGDARAGLARPVQNGEAAADTRTAVGRLDALLELHDTGVAHHNEALAAVAEAGARALSPAAARIAEALRKRTARTLEARPDAKKVA